MVWLVTPIPVLLCRKGLRPSEWPYAKYLIPVTTVRAFLCSYFLGGKEVERCELITSWLSELCTFSARKSTKIDVRLKTQLNHTPYTNFTYTQVRH